MDNANILTELSKYVDTLQTIKPPDKKTKNQIATLSKIKAEDISLGDSPNYFFARIECNSTAVGSSYYNGTETRRTVARDYTTPEYLFIDGHEETGKKGLELFYLKQGQTINYYLKKNILKVANSYGLRLHMRDFRDLNFTLSSHRINRHKVHITKDPFSFPIRPIYAQIANSENKFVLGYTYEDGEKKHIVIEPEKKAFEKNSILDRGFFKILLWIFCPPLAIILAIRNLLKDN